MLFCRVLVVRIYWVTDLRGPGCNDRRIGPMNRTWWFSASATASADPVDPVTAARIVRWISDPRPGCWATEPLSSREAPTPERAEKPVAQVGYRNDARGSHHLGARAFQVSAQGVPAQAIVERHSG